MGFARALHSACGPRHYPNRIPDTGIPSAPCGALRFPSFYLFPLFALASRFCEQLVHFAAQPKFWTSPGINLLLV
ncbi:unnamed protein product [Dicrocoelium dendriticum]|nr:unnamed protein product [Dicrocoelium dendriticum]